MSWWDPIVDYFSGDSGSSIGDAVGQTASNAGSALSGLFSGGDSSSYTPAGLGAIGDYTGGVPVNTTNLAGVDSASAGLMPTSTTSLAGIDAASMGGNNYAGLTNGAGIGGVDSGVAASGGSGLSTAVDWAKKNPSLVSNGIKALGTLTSQNSPAPANTAGYNAASAANAQRSALGSSMISQAPFSAQNAEAAAKGASANAESAYNQRMTAQGYKPGDAAYESGLQQLKLGNRGNEATAYAQGQDEMNKQETAGAGLLTPNLAGYGAMANDQNAQQSNTNKNNATLATLGGNAFDIWANPDKQTKTDSSTGDY